MLKAYWIDFSQINNLAEEVKKRKLEAIGARTRLQALNRDNALKKVIFNAAKV